MIGIRKNVLLLGVFFCGVFCISNALGATKTDSLKSLLSQYTAERNDSLYDQTIISLVEIHLNFDVAKAIQYAKNGLELARKTKKTERIGYWYGRIGDLYVLHDEQLLALEAYHKGLDLAREENLPTGWWNISIGNVYYVDHLHLPKAEKHYEMAIVEFKKMEDEENALKGIAVAFNNIGLVQEAHNNYQKAIDYYQKALKIRSGIQNVELIRHSYGMIAAAYLNINLDSSRVYYKKVESVLQHNSHRYEYFLSVSELYRKTKEYEKALNAIGEAEKIAKESNMLTFLPLIYREYSAICKDQKEYGKAISFSQEGLELAENEQLINYALPLLEQLVDLYALKGNHEKAFEYQQEYINLKDSLHEDQVKNAEVNYELEENEKEVKFLKNNLNEIIEYEHQLEDENKRQHDFLLTFEWGFALATLLGIILFWSFYQQRKQKVEIKEAHDEVLSSIKYAQTIQNAIFPKKDIYDHVFKDHFLISQAKENLSGDFYYLKFTPQNIVWAVGDCTGHGVPGALLSVLGISFLNEIIRRKEVNSPAAALEQMKYQINQNFQDSINGDGMDIGLCAIGKETNVVEFSGAYIPLYIVRKGELITLEASKSSIGSIHTSVPFENQSFQLEKGDMLYMFTDGFTDQFGTDGGRTRKFSRKRLLELIVLNSDKDMVEQKVLLSDALHTWKQKEEQTDDITVLGVQWS